MNSHKRMFVRIIWKAFAHRFSRVMIASLAIAMGAATLSGLGLVAVTVPDYIAKELRSFGANLVVLPQESTGITPETVSAIDRGQCRVGAGRLQLWQLALRTAARSRHGHQIRGRAVGATLLVNRR